MYVQSIINKCNFFMSNNILKPVIYWISENDLGRIYTSDYWNNISEEKNKEWWIKDGNYEKLWTYLKATKLYDDYYAAEVRLKKLFHGKKIIVADLAAGIGWTSALLSKLDIVEEVNCVEISKHRIDLLCQSAIDMFDGKAYKLNRFVGSFYSTKFADDSIDVVFMSQAFHHADKPFFLLQEVSRVLKKNGLAIIIGEHYIDMKLIFKRFFSVLVKQRKLLTNFHDLFQPDPILGDHFYRVSDYFFLATALGFSCEVERLPSGDAMFILRKI
jgi:ubiquinone/menaquinone biosynthesis C-methylase UbiE